MNDLTHFHGRVAQFLYLTARDLVVDGVVESASAVDALIDQVRSQPAIYSLADLGEWAGAAATRLLSDPGAWATAHLAAALRPGPSSIAGEAVVMDPMAPTHVMAQRPGDLLRETMVFWLGEVRDVDPGVWTQAADHYAKLLARGAPPLPADTPTSDDDASTAWLLGQAIKALGDFGREPDAPVGDWKADRAVRMDLARRKVAWLTECLNGDRQPCITEDCRPAHEPLRFKRVVGVDAGSERAVQDVVGERARQIAVGHTRMFDNRYTDRQLARAAAAYALAAGSRDQDDLAVQRTIAPWPIDLRTTDARELLVMSAALAIAEIERMDRAAAFGQMLSAEDAAAKIQAATDAAQALGDQKLGWIGDNGGMDEHLFVGRANHVEVTFTAPTDGGDLRSDNGELPHPASVEIDTGHGVTKPMPPRVQLVIGNHAATYVLENPPYHPGDVQP